MYVNTFLKNKTENSHSLPWLLLKTKTKKLASVSKDVGKLEPLCIAGGNVQERSNYGKQDDGSSKN